MLIAGVDPGLDGALSFMDARDGALTAVDMPTLRLGGANKRQVDLHALRAIIDERRPGHAFVEQVGAMPGQGVASMFNFGRSYGAVLGMLVGLGIPLTLVTPQRWKKAMSVPAGKDAARSRASQLLPAAAGQWTRVKDHGRAEASLIALYGVRSLERIAA